MEAIEGEIVGRQQVDNAFPSVEEVNKNALKRLNELITNATAEEIPGLIDSLSKYNTSIRNNTIFEREESEEEKQIKHKANLAGELLGKP